jgi:acetate kinase
MLQKKLRPFMRTLFQHASVEDEMNLHVLHFVVSGGHIKVDPKLLDHINGRILFTFLKKITNYTPLHVTARVEIIEMSDSLVTKYKYNIETIDVLGGSPLTYAVIHDNSVYN